MNNTISSVTIEIGGNTYNIQFPRIGQLIAIENEKNRLSAGTYSDYTRFDDSGWIARTIIDAIATFTVLSPSLIKDLNINWRDLNLMEVLPITKAYTDIYVPFYAMWIQLFVKGASEEVEK